MTTVLRGTQPGYTYAGSTDLAVLQCPTCHVTYAIPARMQSEAAERGHGQIQWYCPHGHHIGYYGPGEVDRQRERADRATQRANAERDLREHTEHRLRAQKGATTRARKRHAAGLCPCCNRTFSQLRRHMEAKHPDYEPTA